MERASCGVCGASDPTILFLACDTMDPQSSERWPVGCCRRCGHTYLVQRPSRDEIGRYYPKEYGPHQPRDWSGSGRNAEGHRLLRLLRLLHIRPPFDMLDVGCGAGYEIRTFIEQGCRTSGIELDAQAAEEARNRGIDVQCTSVESATFPSGRFQVITMNHALEHLFDPKAALINVKRMLRPDGVLWILFPTSGGLMFRLFREDWYHLEAPRHLQFFTHETLLRLCRETGFRVLRRGTRSGRKGFFRSLSNASRKGGPSAWLHHLSRLGPARVYSKIVLRYIVDGLRLGDVAEYFLGSASQANYGSLPIGATCIERDSAFHDSASGPHA